MMKILLFLFVGTCFLAAFSAPPNQSVLTTEEEYRTLKTWLEPQNIFP